MTKIKATYKITTPLFLSGADQQSAELRPSSVKGALRFWYRATALQKNQKWEDVKKREQELFGSSEKGQGKFVLKVTANKLDVVELGKKWSETGSAYLGYGLIGWDKKEKQVLTARPYLKEGALFSIEVICRPRPTTSNDDIASLKRALMALGLFWGLGARSRHCFGSVSLQALSIDGNEEWRSPDTAEQLEDEIRVFLSGLGPLYDKYPEYTAFSQSTRIAIWSSNKNSLELLDHIGKEMLRYRSYGKVFSTGGDHMLPWKGEKALQLFKSDHDLMLQLDNTESYNIHPKRVVFGLPHNYFFSSNGNMIVNVNGNLYERRSSPLFIHIHALQNLYVAVLTLMPAVFLPEGESIKMSRGAKVNMAPVNVDYGVIEGFLDRLSGSLEVKF